MNALRYLLNFLCGLILYPFAFERKVFWKSDDANQPNQPTSQKPIKIDNFFKNCLIWLKLGMQVSHSPCSLLPAPAHHYCPPLPPLPTVTAPAQPFCRWPQYFSDFFILAHCVELKSNSNAENEALCGVGVVRLHVRGVEWRCYSSVCWRSLRQRMQKSRRMRARSMLRVRLDSWYAFVRVCPSVRARVCVRVREYWRRTQRKRFILGLSRFLFIFGWMSPVNDFC